MLACCTSSATLALTPTRTLTLTQVRDAGVPYVVCWRTKVHNSAARLLASSFFRSLGAGRSPQQAFDDARSALRLVTRPGRLANGTPSSVPAYELADPFGQPADTPAAEPRFSPPPMAAGIPVLLTL